MKRLLLTSMIASAGLVVAADARAWDALNYEQATLRCMNGDRRACAVVQHYQQWERDYQHQQ